MLDYQGEPSVTPRFLLEGGRGGDQRLECYRSMSQGCRQPGNEKRQELILPWSLQKENSPVGPFQMVTFRTLINSCCFKLLSLWLFVTTTTGN